MVSLLPFSTNEKLALLTFMYSRAFSFTSVNRPKPTLP